MVALLAEAAAEGLVATRFGLPVVVTDLDLRYLRKAQVGPVRTRSRLLGNGPDAPVQVELVDLSTDQITTLVYARAVSAPDSILARRGANRRYLLNAEGAETA
jgi:hypothetical protein